MNKLLITIIMGILLIGSIGAFIFSVDNSFKEKVLTLSSALFYDKLVSLNMISLKDVPINKELDLTNSGLEITKNKDGVIRIRNG